MTKVRALAAATVLLGTQEAFAQGGRAGAVSTETCLSTNDKAQTLRNERKLREAREQLKICSQPSCPSAVQKDCSQWLREVEAALPTLSFAAKGADGGDLTNVRVSVDGRILLEQLEGSAVPVDPGKHTFRFDHDGDPTVSQDILVNEGDKARRIDVRFGPAEPPPGASPAAGEKVPASSGARYSPYPFLLAGAGAVLMIGGFAFMANRNAEIPDNCKRVPGRCDGVENTDPILKEATSLKNQSYAGLGIGIGGAAVFAGGVVWFIIESLAPAKSQAPAAAATALRVKPLLGLGYAGLGGTF